MELLVPDSSSSSSSSSSSNRPSDRRGPRRLWRASGAVRCALALLSCALLAALAALGLVLWGAAAAAGPEASPSPSPSPSRASPAPSSARLVLKWPGKIMKAGKLEWHANNIIDGVFLGSGFEYNNASHMLKVKSHGLYYIYAQLNATHLIKSASKEEGNATLTIYHRTGHRSAPILTLPLHLSSRSNKPLAAFSAVSSYQLSEGDLLFVTLTISNTVEDQKYKPTQWYFGDRTAFGLSLISGNYNSEAAGISRCSPALREVEWILRDLCVFFRSNP